MHKRIALLFLLIFLSSLCLNAEQPLKIDFKKSFATKSWPIVSKGFADGSVALENEIFVNSPPSLRIDCGKTSERIVSVTFYLIRKEFEMFKGKTVSFKAKIKRISGAEKPYVQVRFRHFDGKNYQYLFGKSEGIDIASSDWTELAFNCEIPAQENVNSADFQIYVKNSSNPTILIVDECSIVEADSGNKSETENKQQKSKEEQQKTSFFFTRFLEQDASALDIVKDGKPIAVIVTSSSPTKTVQYAIKELNEHIQLSTGTTLAVVNDTENISVPSIHIGSTKLSVEFGISPDILPPDTWVIRRIGDSLVISGGDSNLDIHPVGKDLIPFGTLFATYEFLERVLGVRWYWPGEDGRFVPKHKNIAIGNIFWHGSPSYQTRFAFYAIPDGIAAEDAWVWWRRMRWGGVDGNPVGMHSFATWNEKYGKQHPEWFALQRNGERLNTVDPGGRKNGHLCYSNPEVVNTVVKEARERFDKQKGLKYFTVMPGDSNEIYYCQCKNCQALLRPDEPEGKTHSYAIWTFVNKVAEEIYKTHPDRFITCCAYAGYRIPPEDVHFQPNVAVTLCVPDELKNPWKQDSKFRYVSEIKQWSNKVQNLYVWDYWLYRWKPGLYGAPAIFPHILPETYLVEGNRVKGHVIELCNKDTSGTLQNSWQDWMMDQINVYAGFRLLWDSSLDVDAILKEYYQFFGPAESLIQKFYETMEQAFLNPETKDKELKWDWDTCWNKTYPPEFVNQVMGYLKEAERITRGNEPYHKRVEKILKGFMPFEMASKKYSASSGVDKNKNIVVPETSAIVKIDGKLDEAFWKQAIILDKFVDLYNAPAVAQTEFLLLHDRENFYIGIRAYLPEKEFKKFIHPDTVDGTIWDSESCEIFFAPDTKSSYQFLIGPDNAFTDLYIPDIKNFSMENIKWNASGVRYATSVENELWTAEIKIPFSSIKFTPQSEYRVNFCRNCYLSKTLPGQQKKWTMESSSWVPVFGSFHNIDTFGFLKISN
ncbi:MAG: DUF4838 domain-containing protein [Candidatus Omnitrophica bacterium]|nr:DUF4838 domain-containing protein [Candidatus Omnitrophota bacterium]MCM8827733.1 DUF4838 domain-containing protein [Candidatus Omnitrophota bacterium]